MKNKITNMAKAGMFLGLTTVTILSLTPPARAGNGFAPEQANASGKSSHGGGSGGGGSGGSSFYPTASTVSQLIADINYANTGGGAITITLAPGASFDLTSANNTTDGGNGLPVIGGTTAVALTIIGNGDIIERIASVSRNGTVKNPFRLFDVAAGSSLMLDKVTVKGGWTSGSGGGILNRGTLNVINGSNLSGNGSTDIYNQGALTVNGSTVGSIYNSGTGATANNSALGVIHNQGTMTVSDSTGGPFDNEGTMTVSGCTLSGGYADIGLANAGAMTLSNSTVSGSGGFNSYHGGGIYNSASATMTISASIVSGNSARFGGGIYNDGGTITIKDSTVNNNSAYHYDYPWAGGYGGGIFNDSGTVVIDHSSVTGNTADPGLDDPSVGGGGIFNGDIYNVTQATVTVENDSHIYGNLYDDVTNFGVLNLEDLVNPSSTIGNLDGNPAIHF